MYAFNPNTQEGQASGFLGVLGAQSTQGVQGQQGLYRKTLSQKEKRRKPQDAASGPMFGSCYP